MLAGILLTQACENGILSILISINREASKSIAPIYQNARSPIIKIKLKHNAMR